MSSSDNILRRLTALAAVVCALLFFGASGAHAASTQVVVGAGSFAAEESPDVSDSADASDEQDSSDNAQDDSSDTEDSDDSDGEDSDSAEPTETPTPDPTFSDPSVTDDVTEMPTEDAGETSEAGSSPLGWILLAAGLACAAAAIAVYRRNRHIM